MAKKINIDTLRKDLGDLGFDGLVCFDEDRRNCDCTIFSLCEACNREYLSCSYYMCKPSKFCPYLLGERVVCACDSCSGIEDRCVFKYIKGIECDKDNVFSSVNCGVCRFYVNKKCSNKNSCVFEKDGLYSLSICKLFEKI